MNMNNIYATLATTQAQIIDRRYGTSTNFQSELDNVLNAVTPVEPVSASAATSDSTQQSPAQIAYQKAMHTPNAIANALTTSY